MKIEKQNFSRDMFREEDVFDLSLKNKSTDDKIGQMLLPSIIRCNLTIRCPPITIGNICLS